MNKPFLIFGMPRTGTSLLIQILKSIIEDHGISEYFSNDYIVIDDGNKLIMNRNYKSGLITKEETNSRIQKLIKYENKKIMIKIISPHMTDNIFEYVKNRYQCIITRISFTENNRRTRF